MADEKSADGFTNDLYIYGKFCGNIGGSDQQGVMNKLAPAMWNGPSRSSGSINYISYALYTDIAFDKSLPFTLGTPEETLNLIVKRYAQLEDVSYHYIPGVLTDPPKNECDNKYEVDFGIRTDPAAVVARSVSMQWIYRGYDPPYVITWTNLNAWGLLDVEVTINQYDTPVILAQRCDMAYTSIT